jgi:RNA polymerase-binding transcription factor DksA
MSLAPFDKGASGVGQNVSRRNIGKRAPSISGSCEAVKPREEITMTTNEQIHLLEIPVGGRDGLIWNRLHSEREDICEALIQDGRIAFGADLSREVTAAVTTENLHQELLQARLLKIDDALDRVMSGSYSHCARCNLPIEEAGLKFDPATQLCLSCHESSQPRVPPVLQESIEGGPKPGTTPTQEEVNFARLESFDTILVRTLNSDYRILLLDPKTGRALVEGGQYFIEPGEAWLSGSTFHDSPFKPGSIAVGNRLEMWVANNFVRTSRVQSVTVEHPNLLNPSRPLQRQSTEIRSWKGIP